MNKFRKPLEELQGVLRDAGIKGQWQKDDAAGKHMFRSEDGGVVNWWPSTGTIQVQGKPSAKSAIESALNGGNTEEPQAQVGGATHRHAQIFIVHGHDNAARDQLELALHRLGLEPFVLMNSSGEGKTLIEALEGKIGKDYSSDFGIVLMTPDDVGYAKKDGPERAEPRARQNVVLETGMLLSSLTRARMAIIVKGLVEIPSDLQGIIRLGYNDHIREIIPRLCQRLREVGFDLQPAQIAAAAQ